LLSTYELLKAYDNALRMNLGWLLIAWPLLIFYSTKLMYGSFTIKRFIIASLVIVVFVVVMLKVVMYMMAYGIGQASMNL